MRDLARERVREALNDRDPLSILMDIASDGRIDTQIRVQAASAAAPFMFPRLSAAVVSTAPASANHNPAELVERLMLRFAKMAPPVLTIDAEPVAVEPSLRDLSQ